jgi:hypothetical protein
VGVSPERRRVVDRRRGAERRTTLDRRISAPRNPAAESPSEHVRNALQLLRASTSEAGPHVERADVAAAVERLERALQTLERRSER